MMTRAIAATTTSAIICAALTRTLHSSMRQFSMVVTQVTNLQDCREGALAVSECKRYNATCAAACYHCRMFNFGKPKTAGDWIVHIAGAIVAIFLVWWMLRMFVL